MNRLTRRDFVLAAVLIVLVILLSLPFPFYSRLWHKLLHIIGAVLFIGNIVVTALWMILAVLSGKPAVAHFAAKAVNRADLLFTVPGVLLIAINGFVLAPALGGGNPFALSWVVAALLLLILSGIVWVGFLLRYQGQMVDLSGDGEQLSSDFMRAFRQWGIWGGAATVLPLLSLLLMVFKPTLWG